MVQDRFVRNVSALAFSALAGAAILGGGAASTARADTVYGISNGFGIPEENKIYQINPANADLTNIVQVTLAGHTVNNSQCLVASPSNGSLWAILTTIPAGGASGRRLVTIDPTTGVATLIGDLGRSFSYLAFRSDGTLLGVTGDGATNPGPPETLFTISTTDASSVQLFTLGNGLDGEVIAFHPNGLLYHSSGNSVALFESVNVDTQTVTPIGSASGEAFAMGYLPSTGQMLLSDIGSLLYTVDITTGARTLIGDMDDQVNGSDNRGIAVIGEATGACCAVSGACSLLTAAGCAAGGGLFQAGVCLPNPCPQPGACCSGASCTITTAPLCTGSFIGPGSVCSPQVLGGTVNACCKADFNNSGAVSVQDIFDFLAAYFAGCP